MRKTGRTLEQTLEDLAERGGLLGLSGLSGDVRDLEEAAAGGNSRARLCSRRVCAGIRYHLAHARGAWRRGRHRVTGGIGENGVRIRSQSLRGLEELGIALDAAANAAATRRVENQRPFQPHASLGRTNERRACRCPADQELIQSR